MNILIATSQQHIKYFSVMLESLYQNNMDERFSIYVINEKSDVVDLEPLRIQAAAYGHQIISVPVDSSRFADFPLIIGRWPRFLYFKLLAAELLPADADRVLMLESDMIVTKPIKELYNTDLEGSHIAACNDMPNYWGHGFADIIERTLDFLGIPKSHGFFCGGVSLMNLKKIREDGIGFHTMLTLAERLHYIWRSPEETLLNLLYHASRKALDPWSYCLFPPYWQSDPRPIEASVDSYGTILHYAVCDHKPWDGFTLQQESEWDRIWWKYAKRTAFYEEINGRFQKRMQSREDYKEAVKTIDNLDLHQRTLVRWNYLHSVCGKDFLAQALAAKGFHRIAVYGVNLFQVLLKVELQESDEVSIAYFVDTYVRQGKGDWKVRLAKDCTFEDVDAVIVSAIVHFDSIKKGLKAVKCPVISLSSLIDELLPESFDRYSAIFHI